MPRVAVFTGSLTYSVRKGIVEIDRAIPDLSWLIVLHSPGRTIPTLMRSQWRNLRRNGWRWIPYQFDDLVQRVKQRGRAVVLRPHGSEYTTSSLQMRKNIKILRVEDLHGESSLQAVREFQPDLGLSLAAPILRRSLFSIPRLGTVNLHKGKLPDYRGMPPAFWELWNDEKSVGCSIHWVDDKLDTGAVVASSTVNREQFSTLRGLQLSLDEEGVALMRKAVQEVFAGTSKLIAQSPGGKTYRKPTLEQIAALERKLMTKSAGSFSTARQLIKNTAGKSVVTAWNLGLSQVLTPRITVLLYHRVSDTVRDNLTVGIEQFDRQMELVSTRFQPISLEEVLAAKTIPRSRKPLVCVTFDDGYLDNYSNAAPILLRHQVPAAFFVSTGIISNNGRFPHDVRRQNPPIPLMNWQQLREMRSAGFTIGSHSVNHIDCASESEETVWTELVNSRQQLRQELRIEEVIFAYPYGGRQHMTPDRLELVKKAGYVGCLSAYGGTNVTPIDPFNVRRSAMQWAFSDQLFLLSCLGMM